MSTFKLIIASPDGNRFNGTAASISVRGSEGDLMIMAGHIPFITCVKPCDVTVVLEDDSDKVGHTDGGILTVSAESVTLLTSMFAFEREETVRS